MTITTPEFGATARAATVDPDLDLEDVDDSDLAAIEAELNAEVLTTKRLAIDGRPGWEAEYDLTFTSRDLDNARRKAKDDGFVDKINGARFASILLGRTCVRVWRHGKPLVLSGVEQNFQSRELRTLLKADGVAETALKVYGAEGHLDAACRRVMTEAGWGKEAEDGDLEDPTA